MMAVRLFLAAVLAPIATIEADARLVMALSACRTLSKAM